MFPLLATGLIFVFCTSFVLPWINRVEIIALRKRLRKLEGGTDLSIIEAPVTTEAEFPNVIRKSPGPPAFGEDWISLRANGQEPIKIVSFPNESKLDSDKSMEQQFGGKAFVWLGGIALALAGFFLVKYSLESGILTQNVRIVLGLSFGVILLIGGHILRQYKQVADGQRISQALSGAGIADLYGSFFAATSLYHIFPSWFGFAGTTAITGLALAMSLRYGAPIAALGLLGGFAAPLLTQGEPNAPILFGYLCLVFVCLSAVTRRRNWWWLETMGTVIAFAWTLFWIVKGRGSTDGLCLSLFIGGLISTLVFSTRGFAAEAYPFSLLSCLRYLGIGGSMSLMAAVTYTSNFSMLELSVYGVLSIGTLALAWLENQTYHFAPWLALGANMAMVFGWTAAGFVESTIVSLTFGGLFTIGGYILMSRSRNKYSAAGLSAAGAMGYYLLSYFKLNGDPLADMYIPESLTSSIVWSAIAFMLAAGFIVATRQALLNQTDKKQRDIAAAIFASMASTFVALGLAILLRQEMLALAIVVEILAIGWINITVDVKCLRSIAQALTILFTLLLIPDFVALFDLATGRLLIVVDQNAVFLPSVWTAIFHFGLPSAVLAYSSKIFRIQRDDRYVAVLELFSLVLLSVMSYSVLNAVLVGPQIQFIARGSFTDILMLLSLASLTVGRQYNRSAIGLCGLILGLLGAFRITGFDLLILNPAWSHQMVGSFPLLNGLLLAYGLPAILLLFIKNELNEMKLYALALTSQISAFVLAFVFVTFNVRQFYRGTYLDGFEITNAEIYTYSVVWLIFSIALLIGGAVRGDRMMRIASLVIMMLTVGKAFLYDASQLSGLWRVLSFFGLGLTLLVLSWFYSKFIFSSEVKDEAR